MKTLKDLLVAMINATLILVALCLFLLWQLSGTAKDIAGQFSENLHIVKPLEGEAQALRAEVAGLRTDLGALAQASGDRSQELRRDVEARLALLDGKLDNLQTSLTRIAVTPDRLMTVAIDETADRMINGLQALRGCTAPDDKAAVSPES
ncbi:hypothetical protein [Shimia aestuarii]|uniref:Uncharacterized protein n=1 Tax=Shimia aestuarii TaxID=254406 RepID=A0A1I4PHJ5_9RHOB|nr:hypothetical protein [Shimia aestuarii]SFM26893.1 hypothetical protein SAMN04488042_105232 [Shimia aestuarii]